eukprot:TRINITY_DN6287_c0_g1_i1.p1 TRINITY_DN6287_c0_g1~~TRINITY_DN6287_c0_g1_i1.p1  ORF type:complete len:452 (-),score=71.84 TRINITY_DN6287_c0_g1_i1:519-1874(-)
MPEQLPNGTGQQGLPSLANHSPPSTGEAGRVHHGRPVPSQMNGTTDHIAIDYAGRVRVVDPEGDLGEVGEDSEEREEVGGWAERSGLRMELTAEERERARQRDRGSALIGQKLLQGWTMLGLHCETCLQPIMRNRDREKFCVVCDVRVVSEEEASSLNLQRPPSITSASEGNSMKRNPSPTNSNDTPSLTQPSSVPSDANIPNGPPPPSSLPAVDPSLNTQECVEVFTDEDTPMFTSGNVVHTTVNGSDVIALATDQARFPKPEPVNKDSEAPLPLPSLEDLPSSELLPEPSLSQSWNRLGIVATEPLRDVELSLGVPMTPSRLPPLQPLGGTVAPYQHPFGGTKGGTALPFPGGQRDVALGGEGVTGGFRRMPGQVALGEWLPQVEPGGVTSVAAVADASLVTLATKLEAARRNAEACNDVAELRRILPFMEDCARTMLALQSLSSSVRR